MQKMEQIAPRLVKGDTIGSVPFTLPPSIHNKGNTQVLSDCSGRMMIAYLTTSRYLNITPFHHVSKANGHIR